MKTVRYRARHETFDEAVLVAVRQLQKFHTDGVTATAIAQFLKGYLGKRPEVPTVRRALERLAVAGRLFPF